MQIDHLRLVNWRNFRTVDAALRRRVFLIGPNASGKSNLLDAIKFLRDIAEPEGGFQRAVKARGGVSQIRCLHARLPNVVTLDLSMKIDRTNWRYLLEFAQDNQRRPIVKQEQVWKEGKNLLSRPDLDDEQDPNRLSQTHLEQVIANKEFREVSDFLGKIRYLHIVPQIIREPERVSPSDHDPYGSDFLEQIARTPKRTLNSRLRRINSALQVAVPQLKELKIDRDDRGVPHLKGLYEHWRPKAGWQTEEQFSDGTLRLLGLLWAFLEGNGPLLLEEPELSLHTAVVKHIPAMMAGAGRKQQRQVIVSTHSIELLSDKGISPEEVLLLEPSEEGTRVHAAASDAQIVKMMEAGLSVADAIVPRTSPRHSEQLALFGT